MVAKMWLQLGFVIDRLHNTCKANTVSVYGRTHTNCEVCEKLTPMMVVCYCFHYNVWKTQMQAALLMTEIVGRHASLEMDRIVCTARGALTRLRPRMTA